MSFGPCETKADIRAFARQIFGRAHIVLWIVDDFLGDYRYARVWHGLHFHLIQVDLLYADGELFGGKRKLERLYQRLLRESGQVECQ